MYELMKLEIEHRNLLRSREKFLTTYTYMDRLLKDIYGDEHTSLLPEVKRVDVRSPDPVIKNGKCMSRLTRPARPNGQGRPGGGLPGHQCLSG